MERETAVELMNAWDALNSAAQRMLVAQPSQMTDAAARLDIARHQMQHAINQMTRQIAA